MNCKCKNPTGATPEDMNCTFCDLPLPEEFIINQTRAEKEVLLKE